MKPRVFAWCVHLFTALGLVAAAGIAALIVKGDYSGAFLLIYAAGIWQMRRYAIYLAYTYAIYVAINLLLFTATNPRPASQGEMIFGIVYSILALALTWGAAISLTRSKAELT